MKKVPVMLDLSGKKVLIVGGGTAAQIKIENFFDCGCNVLVVAPDIIDDIKRLVNCGVAVWKKGKFHSSDFKGIALVVAAAEAEINQEVFRQAKQAGIWCATVQGTGDFIFPSAKQVGDLTIAASTNGKYPLLAKKIVEEADYSVASRLDALDKIRVMAKRNLKDCNLRREFLQEVLKKNISPVEDGMELLEVYRRKEKLYENQKAKI